MLYWLVRVKTAGFDMLVAQIGQNKLEMLAEAPTSSKVNKAINIDVQVYTIDRPSTTKTTD